MTAVLRSWFLALAVMAMFVAGPADAQSRFGGKPKAKQEEGVPQPFMRGPERPDPPAVAASPTILLRPSVGASVIPDSAPRMGGLQSQGGGGARCRTSCASTYYRCLSGDEMSSCGGYWARCQSACPKSSTAEF